MFDSILQDLRFGLSLLYKNIKFSLIIIFCLVLGIGPNTAIFSVASKLIFSPPDIHQPERLIQIGPIEDGDGPEVSSLSYPDFDVLRQAQSIQGVTGISFASASAVLPEGSGNAGVMIVTSEFFDIAGREAMIGEVFHRLPEEYPGDKAEVVLGYYFWRDTYNSDPEIIGREVVLNGTPFTITGVMGQSFTGFVSGIQPDIYAPMMMIDQLRPDSPGRLTNDGERWLMTFGRLADGRDIEDARAEFAGISEQIYQAGSDQTLWAIPLDGTAGAGGTIITTVLPMASGIFLAILLVACTSVAALLLARSTERRKEISVRLAMGATRRRLIRMLLTESMILALIAGMFSLLASWWTLDMISDLTPFDFRVVIGNPVTPSVFVFTLGVSLLAGVLFGLAPALQTTRPDLISALKDQPINSGVEYRVSRIRNFFTVVQFGLSVFLLIIAGLFLRGLYQAYQVDPGFDTENLINFEVQPAQFGYTGDRTAIFARDIREELAQIPGVRVAGMARLGPLPTHRTRTIVRPITEDMQTQDRVITFYNYVGPNYFDAMGINIIKGRAFTQTDRNGLDPTIIVNRTMAEKLWPGQDPIGKYLSSSQISRVIGVAEDARYYGVGEEQKAYIYFPLRQHFTHELSVILSVEKEPASIYPLAKQIINDYDPSVGTEGLLLVNEIVDRSLQMPRAVAGLFGILGALALIMAIIGVYGVMSYSVNLRRQEIGIRMSLGATGKSLILMLMRRGLIQISIGSLLGILLAVFAGGPMRDLLSGANPHDPLTFVFVPIILGLVAALSIFIPARRTVRLDPMQSLRYE